MQRCWHCCSRTPISQQSRRYNWMRPPPAPPAERRLPEIWTVNEALIKDRSPSYSILLLLLTLPLPSVSFTLFCSPLLCSWLISGFSWEIKKKSRQSWKSGGFHVRSTHPKINTGRHWRYWHVFRSVRSPSFFPRTSCPLLLFSYNSPHLPERIKRRARALEPVPEGVCVRVCAHALASYRAKWFSRS